jgi:hypothetical protein
MRVDVATIDDFLANLAADGSRPLSGVVRCSVTKTIHSVGSPVVHVTLHAGAVMILEDGGGEYLLDLSVDCGKDDNSSDPDYAGSDCAADIKERLAKVCSERGLTLLPGIVGI